MWLKTRNNTRYNSLWRIWGRIALWAIILSALFLLLSCNNLHAQSSYNDNSSWHGKLSFQELQKSSQALTNGDLEHAYIPKSEQSSSQDNSGADIGQTYRRQDRNAYKEKPIKVRATIQVQYNTNLAPGLSPQAQEYIYNYNSRL